MEQTPKNSPLIPLATNNLNNRSFSELVDGVPKIVSKVSDHIFQDITARYSPMDKLELAKLTP